MNKIYWYFLLMLFLVLQLRRAEAQVFQLRWEIGNLPFDIRIAQGNEKVSSRVSEKGVVSNKVKLPILKLLPTGDVLVPFETDAYIYLFVLNKGKKTVKFSVAPHSTHPGETSLGFHFDCLCNGHVYSVKPGQTWYRIMKLSNSSVKPGENVNLKHVIFEVKK